MNLVPYLAGKIVPLEKDALKIGKVVKQKALGKENFLLTNSCQ